MNWLIWVFPGILLSFFLAMCFAAWKDSRPYRKRGEKWPGWDTECW